MSDSYPVAVVVLSSVLAALVVVLALSIWYIKSHRDPTMRIESEFPIDRLLPSVAGLARSTCLPGNAVEVFENGAFFDVLIEEIGKAQATVHFETFLWKEGALGRRLAAALAARAQAGVKVRVMLDALGCNKMGAAAERELVAAGCRVVKFHERRLRNVGVYAERDHRKLAVMDGRVAFVGGHCIVDEWLGDAEDGKHYSDVSVRLRGPIVHSIQSVFSENWAGETGDLFVWDDVFPELEPAGNIDMLVASVKPEGSAPAVKILHHTVICLARRRLWIQNPYFIPEPEAIDAFGAAVERGVDVRVLMPAASGSDNPMVQHAGHRNFEKLLRNGVRLYEYPHTLLHQKVMTVDGAWCAVGSSNFDDRSFETNDEITLGIHDPVTTRRLDAIFEKYAARAREIELDRWRRRGLWHRAKDNAFYLLNEVL
jgi:cardiolipin synthase